MRVHHAVACLAFIASQLGPAGPLRAQLFVENFDVNPTANWKVNPGPSDNHADFFFDYSTLGIPSAPHAGGTTRGMKLAANLYNGYSAAHGLSVSPIAQSFTGDYVLSFDLWSNYLGNTSGGVGVSADGSTMMSTYGIMSSGTSVNYPGMVDGLFFASTGDGGSAADYRAYSSERIISYQSPPPSPGDPSYSPADQHATHFAGSRNSTAPLYTNNFGGVTVPAAQTALFPHTQFGTTPLGSMGFQWHRVEILKLGTTVTWRVNGIPLIRIETAEFLVPIGGTNILFGHSDTNGSPGFDPNYDDVSFTLIDNIAVHRVLMGDANRDGRVDGDDLLAVERHLGAAAPLRGDANFDGAVTLADVAVVERALVLGAGGGAQSVPEPATAIGVLAVMVMGSRTRPRAVA